MVKKKGLINMKNFKNGLLLCFVMCFIAFVTTGCVKYDTYIEIDKSGSATVTDTAMIVSEAVKYANANPDKRVKEINNAGDPNFTAEKVVENGYTGVKMIYHVEDLAQDDITHKDLMTIDFMTSNHESGRFIDVDKQFFKTDYDVDFFIDFSVDKKTGKKDTAFLELIKSSITIKIPVKATEDNATSVNEDEHIYTWQYNSAEPKNHILLKFSVLNMTNIFITAGVGLLILVLLLTGTIFLIHKKSKR